MYKVLSGKKGRKEVPSTCCGDVSSSSMEVCFDGVRSQKFAAEVGEEVGRTVLKGLAGSASSLTCVDAGWSE